MSLPSATARPTAVDVKLLLSEIQHVRLVRRIRRPPAFRHDVTVTDDHDAVQRVELLFGGLDELLNRGRRNALRFRRAALQAGGRCGGRRGGPRGRALLRVRDADGGDDRWCWRTAPEAGCGQVAQVASRALRKADK